MKIGNLVKHKEIESLGIGFVTELKGVHVLVLWSKSRPGLRLEVIKSLEILNEDR